MLKYAQTTTLILMWCLLISIVSGWLWYEWVSRRRSGARIFPVGFGALPSMVLGPVLLVSAFQLFGWNLLFPVHFFSDWSQLVLVALPPALVLLFASGLIPQMLLGVAKEYDEWRVMPFAVVAESYGVGVRGALRRLVLLKGLVDAWGRCLPWLFGELIIVEVVFNAPGLALDAWNYAKVRDFEGLAIVLLWLALMYGACVLVASVLHRWIGRRLASYC